MRKTETCNRQLRGLLERRESILLPGAANALTARVIEDLGFKAIYVTGAGVTNTFLGFPDIGLISLTELASHVAAMRDAVSLPLIVDADTGFGNAINVARTLQVLERSGANAIQLEDQNFPKRCGHFAGKGVIDKAEMVQKIHAAVDARNDADLVVVARTDAIAANGGRPIKPPTHRDLLLAQKVEDLRRRVSEMAAIVGKPLV
jgi:2,3-dimethylmalate lyase